MANRARRRKPRPRASIPVRSAPDGSELCLQCGLCCDGTLFTEIKMDDDERAYVESLGLVPQVAPDGALTGPPQPCPAFRDGCCSLYEVGRPQTCGSYACGLLVSYTSGRVGLDDCLPVVHLVRSLARELEVEIGVPRGQFNRRVARDYLVEVEPWRDPARYAVMLVAFSRFNLLGHKYFGYKPVPVEEEAAAAGEAVATESAGAEARSVSAGA
jgi:hypothetical protein